NVVIVGSPNVNPGYKLVGNADYPDIAADFARTFRVLKALQCDIFLGAHGSYYGMEQKYARLEKDKNVNPFVDPAGYRKYIDEREKFYLKTIEEQKHSFSLPLAATYLGGIGEIPDKTQRNTILQLRLQHTVVVYLTSAE